MALSIKELMIDDIVLAEEYYIDDNTDEEVSIMHPARVTDISPNCLLWMDGRECVISIDWLDDCSSESTGEIKPMPLTDDIIKANPIIEFEDFYNFEGENGSFMLRYIQADDEDVPSFLRGHWVFDENYPIDYVHQLQQLLRICGLKKFANNFKVK